MLTHAGGSSSRYHEAQSNWTVCPIRNSGLGLPRLRLLPRPDRLGSGDPGLGLLVVSAGLLRLLTVSCHTPFPITTTESSSASVSATPRLLLGRDVCSDSCLAGACGLLGPAADLTLVVVAADPLAARAGFCGCRGVGGGSSVLDSSASSASASAARAGGLSLCGLPANATSASRRLGPGWQERLKRLQSCFSRSHVGVMGGGAPLIPAGRARKLNY